MSLSFSFLGSQESGPGEWTHLSEIYITLNIPPEKPSWHPEGEHCNKESMEEVDGNNLNIMPCAEREDQGNRKYENELLYISVGLSVFRCP